MKKILSTFIIGCILLINFGFGTYYGRVGELYSVVPANGTGEYTFDLASNQVGCFHTSSAMLSCSDTEGHNMEPAWNCYSNQTVIISCTNNTNSNRNLQYLITTNSDCGGSCPECEVCQTCPSTGDILSGYILESSIDSEYCVSNDLCPSSDCPVYTGDTNWSVLYINDIQHEGAGTINVTIPEEFNWDYTNENDVFDLDIEGYNVDTEYIDGIIRTQNYKPTSEDFTRLVGMLAPYSKYLIFLLFMFIIWAWIKKPFKSKKL